MQASDYSYLDQPQFRELYCFGKDSSPRLKFYVEGIKCSKCIAKLETLLTTVPDLKFLEIDLADQTATTGLRNSDSSFQEVAQQIESLGFRPSPVLSKAEATQKFKIESRADLVRVAVAGFCASNIMMFALAVYFGVDESLKVLFEYLQGFLYLPVASYVAWPFYKGFWQGLRQKSLSIDGPMALASVAGFVVSLKHLLESQGATYFDSLSGFLFLILTTRYLQKSTRHKYLSYLRPSMLVDSLRARLGNFQAWEWCRSDRLTLGNSILCLQEDWVPADGVLKSVQGIFDFSLLNGESTPRVLNQGAQVPAGAKLLSPKAEILVEATGESTQLGRILQELQAGQLEASETSKLSDKASQILLTTVFLLALGMLFTSFPDRFERALALIILACPCAMAFGTPLAFAFAMKKAQRHGIIIKSSSTFEKLEQVRSVALDKTGTLTSSHWEIREASESDSSPTTQLWQKIILGLESESVHPVAFALRKLWSQVGFDSLSEFENVREIPSVGVDGTYAGTSYCFRSYSASEQKRMGLFKGPLGKETFPPLWSFKLEPRMREGTGHALSQLRAKVGEVYLLSGDHPAEVRRVAEALNFPEGQFIAEMTPDQKLGFVRSRPHTLMVGDGINDSLALKASWVGVAVSGSVDVALHSADVFILNESLQSLNEMFEIAHLAQSQIRRNLTLALVYNTLGATLAVCGFVNPMLAAALMPASSLVIFFSTWRRLR
jgi:Cu2+-exporting ATPase/Cu+-exporting ATPase